MMNKSKPSSQKLRLGRLLPLLVLVGGGILFFALDGPSYISIDILREYRHDLTERVDELGFLAPLIYTFLYALVVAFSLPVGLVLTLTGGFLFGIVTGLIGTVVGATLGATAVFLAVRMGFGPAVESQNAAWINRMRVGFQKNALSYMLVLRLIPIFPFFLVNLAPALLGVSLPVYFFGTLLGIIPGSFVFILLGNGLGATFDAGGTPNVDLILNPEILAPLIGLAILALVPVAYGVLTKKNTAPKTQVSRISKDTKSAPAPARTSRQKMASRPKSAK